MFLLGRFLAKKLSKNSFLELLCWKFTDGWLAASEGEIVSHV